MSFCRHIFCFRIENDFRWNCMYYLLKSINLKITFRKCVCVCVHVHMCPCVSSPFTCGSRGWTQVRKDWEQELSLLSHLLVPILSSCMRTGLRFKRLSRVEYIFSLQVGHHTSETLFFCFSWDVLLPFYCNISALLGPNFLYLLLSLLYGNCVAVRTSGFWLLYTSQVGWAVPSSCSC